MATDNNITKREIILVLTGQISVIRLFEPTLLQFLTFFFFNDSFWRFKVYVGMSGVSFNRFLKAHKRSLSLSLLTISFLSLSLLILISFSLSLSYIPHTTLKYKHFVLYYIILCLKIQKLILNKTSLFFLSNS